ncbi:3093_t:CDS:10 [Diversispora eburnea]|uniref:3093_t:CDS:1 n=1 Tax=Diversispora eburnea TaxID=1213867 RepID=A0A9N8VDD7_9GLOM|nr:3093_t:CDS:10 [Diversispora eburnea]
MMKEVKEFSTLDCIIKPLDVVRNLLDLIETSDINEFDIPTYFKNIPSINDTPIYDIPNHSLVRFRAMIQNTGLGHEIYASSYETRSQNGQKKWKFNKYTDDMDMDIDDNEILDTDLNSASSIYSNNQLEERLLYYCVSVPGETDWINERNSRLLKKLVSKYPFPNEHHMAAIVKIYGKDDDILKVAEVVEFIGVLIHPRINVNESNNNDSNNNNLQEDGNEFCFDSMTMSNIPCMHSIFYSNNNIHHSGNPLLLNYYNNNLYEVSCQASDTRRNLLQYIASVFGGDEVVAEFVLLQLLSRVRKNGLTLGKFTLNICNIPSTVTITSPPSITSSASTLVHTNQFSKNVSKVLSSILPKYHDLQFTLSTLNEIDYFPNSNNDELNSGVFQVSKGTWFLIDETVMKEGKLNDKGVKNLQALNNLIDNQKLLYTFPFYDFEFETDIGIIILSEAKPFLPYIENQFVIQRRNASRNGQILINHFDLQLRMTLARLVTLSFGESELTKELWDYTQRLDEMRKRRMANFKQR